VGRRACVFGSCTDRAKQKLELFGIGIAKNLSQTETKLFGIAKNLSQTEWWTVVGGPVD